MRKHFYLVTAHEQEERVGGVSVMDSRLSRPEKNAEGPITILDKEAEGFRQVGKQVGLGYHDFASEDEYEDRAAEVMQAKVRDVDRKWAEKAGIEEIVYEEVESA